jgi:hypothetical protein
MNGKQDSQSGWSRTGADHWWWIPTASGVAATAAIAAIAIVPTGASAIPVPGDGGGASTSGTVSEGPTTQSPADYTRPCFMVRAQWNEAEGEQPRCPDPVSRPSPDRARVAFGAAACPSVPDPRYVGGPWYAEVDGCPQVTHWWRYVDVPR